MGPGHHWLADSPIDLRHLPAAPPRSLARFATGYPGRQALPEGTKTPTYMQVQRLDGTFQPDLSILDVLFHLGPGAGDYVDRYARLLRE